MRKRHLVLATAILGIAVLGTAHQARATSYASQLTLSGSTVSFDLSESVNGATEQSSGNGTTSTVTPTTGDVKLVLDGTTVDDLGALASGKQNISLTSTADPHPSLVQVVVTTNDPSGYLAVGSSTIAGSSAATALEVDTPGNTAENVAFAAPRGVTVNTNPSSATFGNVYADNAGAAGVYANETTPGEGIYILNSDMSFQGTNASEKTGAPTEYGSVAGLIPSTTFPNGTGGVFGASPFRLSVGSDGYLYIGSSGDTDASLYRAETSATTGLVAGTGANVFVGVGETTVSSEVDPSPQPVLSTPLQNHGKIFSTPITSGSTAAGNLTVYAVDTDYGSATEQAGVANSTLDFNQLYQWNVGATTSSYGGAPTKLVNSSALGLDTRYFNPQPSTTEYYYNDFYGITTDLARGGPANQFYVTQDRTAGAQPGLFVVSPDDNKTVILDSLDETLRQNLDDGGTADFIPAIYSETVSPDGRFLYTGQATGTYGGFVVPLLAGIPDVKFATPIETGYVNAAGVVASGTQRQSTFDAAGNIYVASSTLETVDEFGAGGTSVAVTSSNGTFTTSGVWTGTGANTNLSNTANFSVGYAPNGVNTTVTFGSTTGSKTVNVDASTTYGAITFTNSTGYTISGTNSINLTGLGGNLTAQAGTNTISAPMTINTDTGLYAASGASLTISGKITYTTPTADYTTTGAQGSAMPNLVKAGQGKVSISNLNIVGSDLGDASSGNLDIYDGTLQLLPNSGAAVVNELSILNSVSGHSNPSNAALDLTNNDLIYDYVINSYTKGTYPASASNTMIAGDPIAVVESLVASGGIYSSTAASTKGTALAVVENDSSFLKAPTSTFDNQTLNPESSTGGAIIIKYTYYGDLNLDGVVDDTDLSQFDSGMYQGWANGDLNYDGTVNADDFALFQLGLAEYNASKVALGSAVPEPATLSLVGLAAIPMLRRRRA